MHSYLCGIPREKSVKKSINYKRSMSYKKSGLIIIISLLSLIALSTQTFAVKLPFDQRVPEESDMCPMYGVMKEKIKETTDASKRASLVEELLWECISFSCYSGLKYLLGKSYVKEEIISNRHPLTYMSAMGYMGLQLQYPTTNKDYPAAYWDVFDLLFENIDMKNQEYFYHLMNSGEQSRFSIGENLYLAARFLSRENTVEKFMRASQEPAPLTYMEGLRKEAIGRLDFSQYSGLLNILMPFGVPLTRLDALQLILPTYQALSPGEQDTVDNMVVGGKLLFTDMIDFQNKFDSLQRRLVNKPFVDEHKKAHEYLITELRRSAETDAAGKDETGIITVLDSIKSKASRKKAKMNNEDEEVSSGPFSVVYGFITVEILTEALKRGLNPNTLISGINFDYSTIKQILYKHRTMFNGPTTHYNLLQWAAMGNIKGTSAEDAVDILLKAGANPHTLPESWNETKQKWLTAWQEKIDTQDLPSSEKRHKLHDLMVFTPDGAGFMNNFQQYLDRMQGAAAIY